MKIKCQNCNMPNDENNIRCVRCNSLIRDFSCKGSCKKCKLNKNCDNKLDKEK
ncbi:hypothetical protein WG909_01030 [Peptostreptococcaceae bacterium AGR-M142]